MSASTAPVETAARQHWMAVLARADSQQLAERWQALNLQPEYQFIRQPEIGLTMLRGRVGGSGSPFNMGEMTLTRCALRLACGTLGVAYIAGRDKQHALTAALADALLQDDSQHDRLQRELIEPLAAIHKKNCVERDAKTRATQVQFFTMVRGED